MATPSIISAINKVRLLLTKEEKLKWVVIVSFAICTSLLEVITASVIVVFAQVLNEPEKGQKYLGWIGIGGQVSPGRVVFYVSLVVGLVYVIKNCVAAAEVFFQNFSIQKMNYKFKNKLLHRYAQTNYGFFLTRNSSFGLQVVAVDAELMFSSGMVSIASILSEGIIFFFLVGMIIYMNPSLAFVIFTVGSLVGFGLTKWVLPKFYQFGESLQDSSLHSNKNLMQFFHAFKEIILLGKRNAFIDAYQVHSKKRSRTHAIQTSINAFPRLFIEVLFIGLFVTTIAILCLEKEAPIQMMGVLGGYLYVGFRVMPGLNRIINQLNTFKSIIPSIERVSSEFTSTAFLESYGDLPDFKFLNQININKVDFRYLNSKKDALSGIALEIKKGECVGVVGETGSGKSTLVDVLLGLLKPHQGAVLIDNKYPVNSIQWHEMVGYVPQSIYLTDDTIEANIAFGDELIDEKQLNEAISAAQLRTFIDKLPLGTKTLVGERGVRLSGGERQRIAIARALYRNPEVLVFDEATSALDNETEAKLMDTIYSVSQNRTVIMIAHRLTTLKNCDRIIVLKNGQTEKIINYKELQNLKVGSHG